MLERIGKDDFILVKVGDDWIPKQVYIWNCHHPDSQVIRGKEVVIFLDRNKRNFQPENLEKLTRSELVTLNRWYSVSDNPEETKLNILQVRLKQKRVEVAKRHGLTDKRGNIIEDVRDSTRRWEQRNPEKMEERKKHINEYLKEKRRNDPAYRMRCLERQRERRARLRLLGKKVN